MNPNPMGGVWLLILILLSAFAVFGAKGKWKLLNLLIIIAFIAAGLGIGAALGAWAGSMAIGGHLAAGLMIPLGAVGGFRLHAPKLAARQTFYSASRHGPKSFEGSLLKT